MLLGRAKSCRWQVFVRRRPPKQGELRTDVSKATMFQGDKAAKDLILLVGSCCLGGLNRGLENLDSPFGKVLILFVRSRHCGELNRGSQNLETFPKGYGFILFACTKRTKSTPEVCEPLDSGDDSNLRSIHGFRESDRPSSCNRPRRALQGFRVSPVRI